MSSEFEAKLLGRVGRGHLPETEFLKRTLRWHEEEANISWSCGAQYVEELAQLLGHTGDRAATKTKTPGSERDWERRTRFAGTAGHSPGGRLSDSGGHDWLHRLGETRLPVCNEDGYELEARAEEARFDTPLASSQVLRVA